MIKIKINPYLVGIHARKPSDVLCTAVLSLFVLGFMLVFLGVGKTGVAMLAVAAFGYIAISKDKESAVYGLLFALALGGFWASVGGYLLKIPALTGG